MSPRDEFARKQSQRRAVYAAMDPRDAGTLCQRCEQRYRCDWMVPDHLWEKINLGHNRLCGRCIADLVERRLQHDDDFNALECKEI